MGAGQCRITRVLKGHLKNRCRLPEHEQKIGDMTRQQGFTQGSLSHEVSPLTKLVSRGGTTVVYAYLFPTLRRYVGQVRVQSVYNSRGPSKVRQLQCIQSKGRIKLRHVL